MLVPQSCQNSQSNPNYLTTMPHEAFVRAVAGDFRHNSLADAISALGNMGRVCKDLEIKVNDCWIVFIREAAETFQSIWPLLHPIDCDKIDFLASLKAYPNACKFLAAHLSKLQKLRDIDLKKWRMTSPTETTKELPWAYSQCFINNSIHNPNGTPKPALWQMATSHQSLNRIDLTAQTTSTVELKEIAEPLIYSFLPMMASSGEWIAIGHGKMLSAEQHEITISITNIASGERIHTIFPNAIIKQLHYDDNHLYVLCKDESKKCKLLRYDCTNWKAAPQTLSIPEMVMRFCLNKNEILFVCSLKGRLGFTSSYQIWACQKNSCFNDPPSFVKAEPKSTMPWILVTDNEWSTLTADTGQSKLPKVVLEQLLIGNSKIESTQIQKFQLQPDSSRFINSSILFDKIFILEIGLVGCNVCVYDLKSGEFLKDFSSLVSDLISDPFQSVFFQQSCKLVLLHTVLADYAKHVTIMLNLDFGTSANEKPENT